MTISNFNRLIINVMAITGIPTILGGLFVVISFLLFSKLRNTSYGLVCLMSFTECIFPLAWLFFYYPPDDHTWQCRFEGWWFQFFTMACIYFSFLITLHLYLMITYHTYKLTNTLFIRISIGAILLALLCSLIPFLTDQYGLLGYSCWIALDEGGRNKHIGFIMRFVLEFGQVCIIFTANSLIHIKIYYYLKKIKDSVRQSLKHQNKPNKVEEAISRLRWYPAILVFCWTGLIVLRIYEFFSTNVPSWSLSLTQALVNLQGFFNALVFASNGIVWRSWKELFQSNNCSFSFSCSCISSEGVFSSFISSSQSNLTQNQTSGNRNTNEEVKKLFKGGEIRLSDSKEHYSSTAILSGRITDAIDIIENENKYDLT